MNSGNPSNLYCCSYWDNAKQFADLSISIWSGPDFELPWVIENSRHSRESLESLNIALDVREKSKPNWITPSHCFARSSRQVSFPPVV